MTTDHILADGKTVTGWCHGAPPQTGGRVCLLCSTLY